MEDNARFTIEYQDADGTTRSLTEPVSVLDDELMAFVDTFAAFIRSTYLRHDPRFTQMEDFWNMLNEGDSEDAHEQHSDDELWDMLIEASESDETDSELLDICEELNSNRDDGPDVCDPTPTFEQGDIVKVIRSDILDSGCVMGQIGKVSTIVTTQEHPTGQTVKVAFAEGGYSSFWLHPSALSLIYRG